MTLSEYHGPRVLVASIHSHQSGETCSGGRMWASVGVQSHLFSSRDVAT